MRSSHGQESRLPMPESTPCAIDAATMQTQASTWNEPQCPQARSYWSKANTVVAQTSKKVHKEAAPNKRTGLIGS